MICRHITFDCADFVAQIVDDMHYDGFYSLPAVNVVWEIKWLINIGMNVMVLNIYRVSSRTEYFTSILWAYLIFFLIDGAYLTLWLQKSSVFLLVLIYV